MAFFTSHQSTHRPIGQGTMSNENVCAASAARVVKKLDLDFAMKEALDVVERLMIEDEKEWEVPRIQEVSRALNMAMEGFEEAHSNFLIKVCELATRNGQDESAAICAAAKRIQMPMYQALLARGDVRVLSQGINDNESYITLAARDAHKSLLAYCSVSTISSEINPEPKPSAPDESDRGYEAMEDPRIINLHWENPCQELQEYPQEESRNPAPGSSSDSFVGEGPLGKKKKKRKRSRHNPRHRNSFKEQQLTIQRKSWTNPPRQGNSSSVKEFPK